MYFLSWVLINEARSPKNVEICNQVARFLIAYCYFMTCLETYQNCEFGTGMSHFGQKKGLNITRRTLFDQKMLIHAINSLAGILYEVRNAPHGTKISLQWMSTVPAEKKLGVTRVHAGRHQTLAAMIKTMEVDATRTFVSADVHVKNRRFTYGEIADACHDLPDIEVSLFIFAQSVPCVLGVPAHMIFVVDHLVPLQWIRFIIWLRN
jgi:hypothetical protein